MAGSVVICDRETAFVQILADYLKSKYRWGLEIEAFDDGDKLSSLYEKKDIDVCLVGEGMLSAYQTEEALKHTGQLIYLTKRRGRDGVFKYQSVEDVTKDLMDFCIQREVSLFYKTPLYAGDRDVKIIGFYSPVHHLLQSSLALTMGQILAKEKRVLYLNFEPYSGFEYMMQRSYEHDLMDILFFLKEDSQKFRMKLDSIIERVGQLEYIPPVFCYPDMEEVDNSMWQRLLKRIVNEMDYEILILDMTEHIRGMFSMLEVCDEIYSCLPEHGFAMAKLEQYKKLLLHMKKETICKNTKTCFVPNFHQLSYQTSMFTHSELANYVKEIMKNEKNGI